MIIMFIINFSWRILHAIYLVLFPFTLLFLQFGSPRVFEWRRQVTGKSLCYTFYTLASRTTHTRVTYSTFSPRIPSVVSRTAWWNLSMWCWMIAWLKRSKYIRPKNQCHILLIMETMPERPWASAGMIIILAALYLVYFVVFAAYAVYVPFFPSEVRYINSAFSCTESVIDLQWFIIRSLHFAIKSRMCWLRLT